MSIDSRVSTLTFDNKQFKDAVSETLNSLKTLDNALNRMNSGKALTGLSDSMSNVDFSKIEAGLETLKQRFSIMGIVGMTVIQRITNAGISGLTKIGNKMTAQFKEGGMTRSLNLEQAKFLLEGLNADVDAIMDNVNEAVDGTAYGLDEAAKAAASFAASGIKAGDSMTSALRAVAGTAAMTGSDFASIADIYTTVAGQGKLMTMQLRELEGRGLNAAAILAKTMNKSEGEIRDMVTAGKISFEEFATSMDENFGEHAKDANLMFTGALANMKTALSRMGAKFYQPGIVYMRDIFNQTREAINSFSESIDPAVKTFETFGSAVSKSIVQTLKSTQKLGTFTNLGKTATNIFKSFIFVLEDVKDAFSNVFLPGTKASKVLVDFSKNALSISDKIKSFVKQTDILTKIFTGFFNIIKTGWNVFSGFYKVVKSIFVSFNESTNIINKLVDGFVSFTDYIKRFSEETKIFEDFASSFGNFANGIGKLLSDIVSMIKKIAKETKVFDIFSKSFGSVEDTISGTMNWVGSFASSLVNVAGKAIDILIDKFHSLLNILSEFFNTGNNLAATVTMGGTIGSLSMIGTIIGGLFGKFKSGNKIQKALIDLIDKFKEFPNSALDVLDSIREKTAAMQKELKGKALLEIGVGLLAIAAAVKILSDIPYDKLAVGIGGLASSMGILLGGYAVMSKIMESVGIFNNTIKGKGAIKQKDMISAATTMFIMSGAMVLLAKACTMLSGLSIQQIATGLGGVTVMLGVTFGMIAALNKLKVDSSLSLKTGISLIIIAEALKIMAEAVEVFGKLDVAVLSQGMKAVVVSLGAMVGLAAGLDKLAGGIQLDGKLAAYILGVALAMKMFASAVGELGGMNPSELVMGLGAVLTLMTAMLAVSVVIGKNLNAKRISSLYSVGIAMIGISAAMKILASAMKTIAGLTDEGLLNSLVAIVSSLVAFTMAAKAMSGSESGAGGILLMAVAIGVLAASLKVLGSMDVDSLARSLLAMGIALGMMAVVAVILQPMATGLLAVGGALLMIGGSVALAGSGILMLATGLSILAAVGSAAITSLLTMLNSLLVWVGSNIAEISKTIVNGLVSVIQEIVAQAPKVIESITNLIGLIVTAVSNNIGKIVDLAVNIIMTFLTAIKEKIKLIAGTAALLIAEFINGVSTKLPDIIQSAINLIVSFINGLANGIRNNADSIKAAIINLCDAILDAFKTFFGINSPSKVMNKQGTYLIEGLLKGIKSKIKDVSKTIIDGIKGIPGKISALVSSFMSSAKEIISGVLKGLGNKKDEIKEKITGGIELAKDKLKSTSFYSYGKNIIQGFLNGLNSLKDKVIGFWNWISDKAASIVEKKNEMQSPSKKYFRYGKYILQGFINGLNENVDEPAKILENMSKAMANVSFDDLDSNPVITPIIDISDAKSSINTLNSMLNGKRTIRLGSDILSSDNRKVSMADAVKNGMKNAISGLGFGENKTYNINGITVNGNDDVTKAIEILVRATKIEGRI